jgi:hypothetical protein
MQKSIEAGYRYESVYEKRATAMRVFQIFFCVCVF